MNDILTKQELEDLKSGCERSPHVPSETVRRLIYEVESHRRSISETASLITPQRLNSEKVN